MKLGSLRWTGPAVITVLLSGPAFAAASLPQSPTHVAAPAQTAPAPAPKAPVAPVNTAVVDESERYGQREKAAQGLEQFQGGEGVSIYVGGSVLALALLLVVLLVLL